MKINCRVLHPYTASFEIPWTVEVLNLNPKGSEVPLERLRLKISTSPDPNGVCDSIINKYIRLDACIIDEIGLLGIPIQDQMYSGIQYFHVELIDDQPDALTGSAGITIEIRSTPNSFSGVIPW